MERSWAGKSSAAILPVLGSFDVTALREGPGPGLCSAAPLRLVLRSGCANGVMLISKMRTNSSHPRALGLLAALNQCQFFWWKEKSPNFSWCSCLCVEILAPALALLCGRLLSSSASLPLSCVCSASQVGWPQPFLKHCIMSVITHLAGMLPWDHQGLLDNPHPFPWEEQHHKDH